MHNLTTYEETLGKEQVTYPIQSSWSFLERLKSRAWIQKAAIFFSCESVPMLMTNQIRRNTNKAQEKKTENQTISDHLAIRICCRKLAK